MRRFLIAAVLTAAITVTTGCASEPPPVSTKVQEAYDNINRTPLAQRSAEVAAASKPVTVFIGDSYTNGTGASSPATKWTALVTAGMDWKEINIGRGSTSYLATGTMAGCGLDYCPNYQEMIPEAKKNNAATVVVAGGQNDFSNFERDPQSVILAINGTYAGIRAELPEAKIVAVGPSTPWGMSGTATAIDEAVKAAAAAQGAVYISLLEPNVISEGMVLPDGGHVNDEGHKAIAERVLAALR